jgi:mRNA interferase HigB
VILTGKSALDDFKKKHPGARKALAQWQAVIEKNVFRDFLALKAVFPSVDYVKKSPYTVFDIRGNNYRLAVIVVYRENRCIVERVMTHEEYDRWCGRFK